MPDSEQRKAYKKQWREDNKEHLQNQWKEYYEEHKNEISKKKTEYRNNNKDYINEKIKCNVCGSMVSRHGIAKHHQTNKCMKAIPIDK